MTTEADYWAAAHGSKTVPWRTARKAHWCLHQRQSGGKRCAAGDAAEAIQPGDTYLDTGGRFDPLHPFGRTAKVCAGCAARPTEFNKDQSSTGPWIWSDPS